MTQPFFAAPDKKKPADDDEPKKDDKVRTQMMGEAPGEDLGYDPATIPVEDIPDED